MLDMKLAVEVTSLLTTIFGIVLAWLGVVGTQAALNDGLPGPEKNMSNIALAECCAVPVVLVLLFVVPSLMLRSKKPMAAMVVALLPYISTTVAIVF